MDIVYILRDTDDYNYADLRYSLRSLKNIPHDKVFIVGGLPKWAKNIHHVTAKDGPNKSLNGHLKLKVACEAKDISEDFILMNDDMYYMKKIQPKICHAGDFQKSLKKRTAYCDHQSTYHDLLVRSADFFENPIDYATHYPFIVNKKKYLKMCGKYDMNKVYSYRILYGNEYRIGGAEIEDCKAFTMDELLKLKDRELVSSNDNLTQETSFHFFMCKRFQACKYEDTKNAIVKMFLEKSIYDIETGNKYRRLEYHELDYHFATVLEDARFGHII